jgi:hypothetical protein
MPESFPQDSARPLGKGYSEIMQMVLSYAAEGKTEGNPTLAHSLDRFRCLPDIRQHLAGLSQLPLCLIQGYSTPGNAKALRQFIHDYIGSYPRIETVDLYDLPHLYDVLDIRMPQMRYHIADASHLDHLYPDGAIDLVVQDFLLNCIPASRHETLLKEVSRILKSGGLGIISFTSSEALKLDSAMSTEQLKTEHHLTWDPQAYDLAEMAKANNPETSLDYLKGRLVYHQPTSEFIYIAKAGGRFEFFRSKEEMLALFEKCGLHLLSFDASHGTDDHGLACMRYRCILAKNTSP